MSPIDKIQSISPQGYSSLPASMQFQFAGAASSTEFIYPQNSTTIKKQKKVLIGSYFWVE